VDSVVVPPGVVTEVEVAEAGVDEVPERTRTSLGNP